MNKEWVQQKQSEQANNIEIFHKKIREALNETELLTSDDIDEFINDITETVRMGFTTSIYMMSRNVYEKYKELYKTHHDEKDAKLAISAFYEKILKAFDKLDFNELRRLECIDYTRYQDSELVEFDGDIIITDPCYIIKSGKSNDWQDSEYGDDLTILGINNFITRDTLYGDWSCTTFNTDTKRKIGNFCADAGMVSVILLEDVLKYNPDFNYHIEKPWTTTLIKNFKGTVQFVVKEVSWTLDRDTSYGKKGDTFTDYEVEVEGCGINKKTKKPINFIGRQTGL